MRASSPHHATIVNRSQLFAAATAIGVVGFLTLSPPAQARPMLPLNPPCSQYGFTGDVSLRQSNGALVSFSSAGPGASGRATATGTGGGPMQGTISGSVQGRYVDLTIRWDSGPIGHYTGLVGYSDDFAGGDTVDETNPGSTAHWDSTVPLGCITPPSRFVQNGPAPAAPPGIYSCAGKPQSETCPNN